MKPLIKIILRILLYCAIVVVLFLLLLYNNSTFGKTIIHDDYWGDGYYKDSKNVYFKYGYLIHDIGIYLEFRMVPLVEKIEGADPSSFSAIDNFYDIYTDKNNIYYSGNKLTGADRQTFEILKKAYTDCQIRLARDKGHVYFFWFGQTRVISGADPNTFGLLSCYYAKDAQHVYNMKMLNKDPVMLAKANAESFKVLPYDYAKDKNYVYYQGNIFDGADASTFQVIVNNYTKDKNHVYFSGKVLSGADSLTVKAVPGTDKVADSENVYDGIYCVNQINKNEERCRQKIDPETAALLKNAPQVNYSDATDKPITREVVSPSDNLLNMPAADANFYPSKQRNLEGGEIVGAYDIMPVAQARVEDYFFKSIHLTVSKNQGSMTNNRYIGIMKSDSAEKISLGSTEYVKFKSDDNKTIHYESFTKDYQFEIICNAMDKGFTEDGLKKIENFISAINYKVQ